MIENILDAQGHIVPTALACKYNTTVEELSIFSGVSLNTLKKRDRSSKPITQAKLKSSIKLLHGLAVSNKLMLGIEVNQYLRLEI